MIACRSSFSRLDHLLRVACVRSALPNHFFTFQGCVHDQKVSCICNITGAEDKKIGMERHKKQKASLPMRRALSTKSSLHEGAFVLNDNLPCAKEENQPIIATSEIQHSPQMVAGITDFKSDVIIEQEIREDVLELCPDDAESSTGEKKFSDSVEVGASLIRFLKGESMQRQIEGETGVKLVFPSSKEESFVVITGTTIDNVTKASEKIASIIEEVVKSPKLDYSHFISLPLAIHPDLVEKLTQFQNSILGNTTSNMNIEMESELKEDTSVDGDNQSEDSKLSKHIKVKDAIDSKIASKTSILSDMGIDKSLFIKPKTFHLTVLMLKLWNKERISAASEVLQKISTKVLDALENRPVSIRLSGLMCMKGSPAKARVVYAPVKEIGGEGRLLRACQVIIDAYVEAGLVLEKDAHQALKLHATLMNARHRRRGKGPKRHDSFDARHIFKVYGSQDWGEYVIPEVHLSQRFKFDDKGYYHCCASVPLPDAK